MDRQHIPTANPSDFRNLPECVFHVTDPSSCFNTSNEPQTVTNQLGQTEYINRGQNTNTGVNGNPYDLSSWRVEVKRLFDNYNFQFHPSFRKSVPPYDPETDPSLAPSIRPPSSIPCSEHADSETASQASKPRSAGRRLSRVTNLLVEPPTRQRRPSITSIVKGKKAMTPNKE